MFSFSSSNWTLSVRYFLDEGRLKLNFVHWSNKGAVSMGSPTTAVNLKIIAVTL